MTYVLREVVTPGGARAGGFAPSASVPVSPGGATASGIGPIALVFAVFYPTDPAHSGWHLATDPSDLIVYGMDLAVVVAFVFVSAKLVATRRLR